MKKSLTIAWIALFLCARLSATLWYVESGAGGSNNGTSWANAWTSLGAINWASIVGGDTLYIGGGSGAGISYGSGSGYAVTVVHSGTTESDRITIRCGQDAGHTSPVTINGGVQMGDNSGNKAQYVTLDGSYSGARNIFIVGTNTGGGANGFYIRYSATVGNKYTYLDVSVPTGSASDTNGFDMNNYCTLTEISYCYLHDIVVPSVLGNAGRGIKVAVGSGVDGQGSTILGYGGIAIHHNTIGPNVKNDAIAGDGGCDIYNNILDGTGCDNVLHADGIQSVCAYQRIYNNVIHDHGQEIFIETTDSSVSNILIYNNVIYTPASAVITSPGVFLRAKLPNPSSITWTNFIIANNIFYLLQTSAFRILADSGVTLTLTSCQLSNNIFASNSGGNTLMNQGGEGTVSWTTGNFLWSNNDFNNPQSTNWAGTSYSTVALLQAGQSSATGNIASTPLFTNTTTFDLTPTGSSPVIGAGTDVSSFTASTDKNGVAWAGGTGWGIGAYKATASAAGGSSLSGKVSLTGKVTIK